MSSELRSSTTFCTKPLISARVSGLRWVAKRGCSSLRPQIRLNVNLETQIAHLDQESRGESYENTLSLRPMTPPKYWKKIVSYYCAKATESERANVGRGGRYRPTQHGQRHVPHASTVKKLILSIHGQNRLRTRFKKGFSSDVFLWNACWKPYESAINLE